MQYIPTLVDEETRKELLDDIAKRAKNDMLFVEVGAFVGGTVCHLGQRLKEYNKNCRIIAIDNWICSEVSSQSLDFIGSNGNFLEVFNKNIEKTGIKDIVNTIQGDSIEISKQFLDNSIDFLFVDGLHSYPYNKYELEAWLPKMKKDSILAGHDYCSLSYMPSMLHELFGDNIKLTSNKATYIINLGKGL